MDLPAAQVADPTLMEFNIVAVIHRFRCRGISMLVVSEVGRDRRLFQCAIGGRRRKSELERQQHEEEKGEEAAHGKIMAELLDDLEGDVGSRSPAGPAEPAWLHHANAGATGRAIGLERFYVTRLSTPVNFHRKAHASRPEERGFHRQQPWDYSATPSA